MTGKQIKNGSLSQVEFKFAPASGAKGDTGAPGPAGPGSKAKGISVNDPTVLAPGADFQTIAELHTSTDADRLLLLSGGVEELSASKTDAATVELRIVHNGEIHPVPSRNTVGVEEADVGVVSLQCNGTPGPQDIQLQARTTNAAVTIGARNLALAETVHLP